MRSHPACGRRHENRPADRAAAAFVMASSPGVNELTMLTPEEKKELI